MKNSFVAFAATCLLLAACNANKTPKQDDNVASSSDSGIIRTVSTSEFQDSMSPDAVLQKFKDGNKRFLEHNMRNRDLLSQVDLTASGQHPYAGCIDSRKPAEIIFDKGIGDMFNARIAGNFVNTDILGSLEFATKVAGAKLILIMGHTECGAVKSACDDVKLGNITAMLSNIRPAVEAVKGFNDARNSKNPEFVQAVAKENVLLAREKILRDSPIIKELVDKGQVAIHCCMYDLSTGAVTFYD